MSLTQTKIEDLICEALTEVAELPIDQIDRDESLDALGLDSVAKVGLITSLENQLGVSVAVEQLIESETPRELAVGILSDSRTLDNGASCDG